MDFCEEGLQMASGRLAASAPSHAALFGGIGLVGLR